MDHAIMGGGPGQAVRARNPLPRCFRGGLLVGGCGDRTVLLRGSWARTVPGGKGTTRCPNHPDHLAWPGPRNGWPGERSAGYELWPREAVTWPGQLGAA